MDIVVGAFISLFQLVFSNFITVIITYIIILSVIRLFGIWKIKRIETSDNQGFKSKNKTRSLKMINVCPRCGSSCNRVERNSLDKIRTIMSANLMQWKRYHCYSCYWEGSRW